MEEVKICKFDFVNISAFTFLHLPIFTLLHQGVRETELVGRLPEEGSAGQSCLEAACRLLDHSRERLEGASRLLDHTLRCTVALFAESFREFSSKDLFHMYLPVNYRRRTNKSMNLVVIVLLIGFQGLWRKPVRQLDSIERLEKV